MTSTGKIRQLNGLAKRNRSEHTERKSGSFSWFYYNDHLRVTISALAKVRNISRTELAKAARAPLPSVSNYLNKSNKKKQLTDMQVMRICDFLDINVELKITINE